MLDATIFLLNQVVSTLIFSDAAVSKDVSTCLCIRHSWPVARHGPWSDLLWQSCGAPASR